MLTTTQLIVGEKLLTEVILQLSGLGLSPRTSECMRGVANNRAITGLPPHTTDCMWRFANN